ncbi:DUF1266 domain-containing protein [Oscillatoria laete-virens NRMC-F 0139]|nr:DUF1266 domain-containing protein [Oscillatoria laete-virens]MDL5051998.1 DUF1266 domain-containing protein [Oscillatoria laete-virens NRMC-F 0139]
MEDKNEILRSRSLSQLVFIIALLLIAGGFAYGYLVRPASNATPAPPAPPVTPAVQTPRVDPVLADAATLARAAATAPELSEQQKRWLLACSAMLAVANNQSHDTLAGYEANAKVQEHHRGMLSKWWGIKNAGELRQTIASLEAGTRHDGWKALAPRTPPVSDAAYQRAKDSPLDLNARFTLRMREGRSEPNYLKSWDYCRAMNITRWGHLAGYFDEAEAWSILYRIGPKLQASYKSWEEQAIDYGLGFELWFKEGHRRNFVQELLSAPNSPWRTIPWNQDLSVRKP